MPGISLSARVSVGVVALGALLLAPSLLYALGRDQSIFAYAAQVIRDGGVPYRDVWDFKPPGIYWLYGAISTLAGPSMLAVRAADLVWTALTLWALLALARQFLPTVAAASAVLWYAGCYLAMGFWGMAQTESFAALPVICAVSCWYRGWDRRSPGYFFLAGLLGGTAAVLKYPAALGLAAPLLAVALTREKPAEGHGSGRGLLRAGLLTGAGVLLPLLAMALTLRVMGCWDAYLDIQRSFVTGYTELGWDHWTTRIGEGTLAFVRGYRVPVFAAIVGWMALFAGRASRAIHLCFAWLLMALTAVWLQGKCFEYHWTLTLPPLCLLAGAACERIAGTIPRLRSRVLVAALALALPLAWCARRNGPEYADALRWAVGSLPTRVYQERFSFDSDFSFVGDQQVAEYVRTAGTTDRGLFIWGFEPLVYLLSGTRAPTRFVYTAPLVAAWSPARWRAELMRDLYASPPEIVLVIRNDIYPHVTGSGADSATLLEQFPELDHFLRTDYGFDREIEDFLVYHRRAERTLAADDHAVAKRVYSRPDPSRDREGSGPR